MTSQGEDFNSNAITCETLEVRSTLTVAGFPIVPPIASLPDLLDNPGVSVDVINGAKFSTDPAGGANLLGRTIIGPDIYTPLVQFGINGNVICNGMINAAQGFRQGGVSWTSGAGSPEGVVTADVGSMFSRTDGGTGTSLYVKESGTATPNGWVGVGQPATRPPGQVFDYLEDFMDGAGTRFTTDFGAPATSLADSGDPYIRLAQIVTGAPGDGAFMELGDAAIFGNFLNVGNRPSGRLLIEWGGSIADLSPTVNDFTARFVASTLMSSSLVAGNGDGFGFSLGIAQNGNANLWGFLNDVDKVDLGILNDTNYHRYRVVYTFGTGVEWFVDDVLLGSFVGVPSAEGLAIDCGMNLRAGPLPGATPDNLLDYVWINYVYTRP